MQQAKSHYSQRIDNLGIEQKRLQRKSSQLYLLRLTSFALLITLLVILLSSGSHWMLITSMVLIVLIFAYLVREHINLSKRICVLSNRINVNSNEEMFINHNLKGFAQGNEYHWLNPNLSDDFDLFGQGSLFQYINRTSTVIGQERLASKLCCWDRAEEAIYKKQEAIAELAGKLNFLEDFQTYGRDVVETGDEVKRLADWVESPNHAGRLIGFLLWVYPAVVILLIILVSFSVAGVSALLLPLLFSLFLINRYKRTLDVVHSRLGNSAKVFRNYAKFINLVEKERFSSSFLAEQSKNFAQGDREASLSISKLFKLLEWFDLRFNLIVSILLNVLFLFDFQILAKLERWKKNQSNHIKTWFEALAEIDSLISFARFAYNNKENVVYPLVETEPFCVKAVGLGHPLIHQEQRVNNDVSLVGKPKLLVVTGANMAGKSTFLRTLVVNLILAHNGSPVCAKSLSFSSCSIVSSINISDSLAENQSYFYAELIRLRGIIEQVKKDRNTIVVLDEILRGTNTKDKHIGTSGLLRKLIGLNAFTVLATHDLTIGKMEHEFPEIVKNHCFEVELENEQLIFDYKLKDGISTRLNASFLMRKMGVLE